MALVKSDNKLCDVIIAAPSVITVINRFNITLGVGDKSINAICEAKGIDTGFFITILNTFINEDYFPENILKSFKASKIIEYLNKTNAYYEMFQIPNIEHHFNSLINKSDSENNNLELMRKFFLELKKDILARIKSDKNHWFPEIIEAEEKILNSNIPHPEFKMTFDATETDPIEDKLNDLKNMFVMHLTGEYDRNLCHAVLFAIISLEKDMKQNNRIRERILRPISNAMVNLSTEN